MMYVGREMRAGYGTGLPDCLPTYQRRLPARLQGGEPRQGAVGPWPGRRLDELKRYVPTLARPDEMLKYPHPQAQLHSLPSVRTMQVIFEL